MCYADNESFTDVYKSLWIILLSTYNISLFGKQLFMMMYEDGNGEGKKDNKSSSYDFILLMTLIFPK